MVKAVKAVELTLALAASSNEPLQCLGTIPASAAEPIISKVAVNISDDKGQPLPRKLALRIQASVNAVAEQVLLGRPLAVIEPKQAVYERMVREVFDRILIGYSVETAAISVGEETQISLRLSPWGDVVEQTTLVVEEKSFPPQGRAELDAKLETLKNI